MAEPSRETNISLKDFFLQLLLEHEKKYEQRFVMLEQLIKDKMTSNAVSVATALASLDRRFETVNEFRAQLVDQQATFARKIDVETLMVAMEKASAKSEAATEKRLQGVNEFRAQLADQQATLVRKSEVDIRFDALEKKLDTAITQLQHDKGREHGIYATWAGIVIGITLLVTIGGLILSIVSKR